jgi:hypothetical protein
MQMSTKSEAAKGGVGYPPVFREQTLAFLGDIDADSKEERVAEAASTFGVSVRSIYRWAARQQQAGNVLNVEHKGGSPRTLTGQGDILLMLYMGTSQFVQLNQVFLCGSGVPKLAAV